MSSIVGHTKVSIEMRMKTYCSGCGAVFYISQLIAPHYDNRHLTDMVLLSKEQLLNALCNICRSGLSPIDFYEEPPKPKKKRKKKK